MNTFAQETNVNTSSRLLIYDIKDLGELKTAGMLVMLDNIINRVSQNRDKNKTTYVLIDELHLMFQKGQEYSVNVLYSLWRRARKYGLYLIGITQNIEDLLQSHTARSMLANSEFLVLLNQSETDKKVLGELLGISPLQMSAVDDEKTGRGLLKVGSSIVPFVNEFPKDTELYKMMTTKPGELEQVG